MLKDKDEGVRQAAAQAFWYIGPKAKTAIPALTTLLKDKDDGVRGDAAEALGDIGPVAKTAIPLSRNCSRTRTEKFG